jgi:flotillin
VADNEKMGETRVAAAERDKSVQVANARKEQAIGTREAQRDQPVSVANLEKQQIIGEKTAAFEKDSQVKLAEQAMRVQVAEADAGAIDGENQAAARVAGSQAELAIKKAEAYERGEGRRKQAEAHVLEVQNKALAQAALAEATRIEAEQRAKLEAPAKAQKAKQIVDAEAAAEQRRIIAQAEADAIYVKLEAEARGQYEILAKKGEGLKNIVTACGGSTQAFQMLMLEHLDNLADASARAISNIKFDKIVVWEGGGQNGRGSTADFLSGMAKTLPPMMQVMRDIGGVELPESLVKLAGDKAETNGAAMAHAGSTGNGPAAPPRDKGKA